MTDRHENFTQTKDMIADALFILMNKMEFSQITVKELTECAQVARRTFYKHFKTKDDVIDYRLQQMDAEFNKELTEKAPVNPEAYGNMFFSFFKAYTTEISALHRHNMFFTHIYYMYSDSMRENDDILNAYKMYNNEYNIAYRFGGIFFMLVEWIENGATVPPEEMAKYFAKEIPQEFL